MPQAGHALLPSPHRRCSAERLLEAAEVNTENPVTVNNNVDYVVSEETAQKVARDEADNWWYYSGIGKMVARETGLGEHLPQFTPVSAPWVGLGVSSDTSQIYDLYAVSQTWDAGPGYDPALDGKVGWFGYTSGQPMLRQSATIKVCGYRDGQEVHCYEGGFGDIFPSVLGMTQTLHSP
jgi:hypothetical protein